MFREIGIDDINVEQYMEQCGDITKFMDKLRESTPTPDEIMSRLGPNLNEALQALKALDPKALSNYRRAIQLEEAAIRGRREKAVNKEGQASTPNAVVSGEEEKKFLEILGRHTLEINPEDPVSLAFLVEKWAFLRIWDEPNPHEKLTHPAWNTPTPPLHPKPLHQLAPHTHTRRMYALYSAREWIRDGIPRD